MSFWDVIKGAGNAIGNVASRGFNGLKDLLISKAPEIGQVIGQRMGAPGVGSALGQVIGGLGGGGHDVMGGLQGLGRAGVQAALPHLQGRGGRYQQMPVGQIGGAAGSDAGQWLGQKIGGMMPASWGMQQRLGEMGSRYGRQAGQYAQGQLGLSPQTQAVTLAQLPGQLANYGASALYNRTPQGREAARENMQGFAELPGMAHGGYMDGGAMFNHHHQMNTMYPMPHHNPTMAHGGYVMPENQYHDGGYAMGGPGHVDLRTLIELMPHTAIS